MFRTFYFKDFLYYIYILYARFLQRLYRENVLHREIPTFRNKKGKWHITTVQNLLKKIERLELK